MMVRVDAITLAGRALRPPRHVAMAGHCPCLPGASACNDVEAVAVVRYDPDRLAEKIGVCVLHDETAVSLFSTRSEPADHGDRCASERVASNERFADAFEVTTRHSTPPEHFGHDTHPTRFVQTSMFDFTRAA